jgi:hypothetical protein
MLVVIGGHSRNIGKTSVTVGIIRGLPEARWTAMKITQFGHGVCSHSGESCGCHTGGAHPFELTVEEEAGGSDSGRFAGAGAEQSYWLRTAAGQLGHAVEEIRRILSESDYVIVESNSVLQYFHPDLYLPVLHYGVGDWKDSARLFVERADALVVTGGDPAGLVWQGVPSRWTEGKPIFRVSPPDFSSDELVEFVGRRIGLR